MIIAIDPGASGGIAWQGQGMLPAVMPMPETDGDLVAELTSIYNSGLCRTCYIEDLVKYTGRNMPSSAMAVYARNFGFIEGSLASLGCRVVRVKPQVWHKVLGLGNSRGGSKAEWKNKLKGEAQRLFPHLRKQITLKTADALLILEYGRRYK